MLQILKGPKQFAYHFSEVLSHWNALFFFRNLVTTYLEVVCAEPKLVIAVVFRYGEHSSQNLPDTEFLQLNLNKSFLGIYC